MSKDVERVIEGFGLTEMRGPIDTMLSRVEDFPSEAAALLAGIGVQEEARRQVDAVAFERWNQNWVAPTSPIPEVVIGSGPHALIYAAVRAAKGIKVVILEKNERAGGAFACSEGPAFWLNSRNRPGELGLPGEGRGLNVLPGCILQPSMIGGGEYQTNDQLAWVIRMNLMILGVEVHTGVEVVDIDADLFESSGYYTLGVKGPITGSGTIKASRVLIATGVGEPRPFFQLDDKPDRLLNFNEFMAKMDTQFPLRGMDRVAVIGAGDSGKTVVESLLGQGPSTGMSVSALDFPAKIDWYGCEYGKQAEWCSNNRGRYGRIGKALGGRVQVKPRADYYPTSGFESVQIGPRIYDWVINCIGFRRDVGIIGDRDRIGYIVGGRALAQRMLFTGSNNDEVFLIGPAAGIALPAGDRTLAPTLARVPDNASSLFRYAPLTAAFADSLPSVN